MFSFKMQKKKIIQSTQTGSTQRRNISVVFYVRSLRGRVFHERPHLLKLLLAQQAPAPSGCSVATTIDIPSLPTVRGLCRLTSPNNPWVPTGKNILTLNTASMQRKLSPTFIHVSNSPQKIGWLHQVQNTDCI